MSFYTFNDELDTQINVESRWKILYGNIGYRNYLTSVMLHITTHITGRQL